MYAKVSVNYSDCNAFSSWEVLRTSPLRGRSSRHKVSVEESAEGSYLRAQRPFFLAVCLAVTHSWALAKGCSSSLLEPVRVFYVLLDTDGWNLCGRNDDSRKEGSTPSSTSLVRLWSFCLGRVGSASGVFPKAP